MSERTQTLSKIDQWESLRPKFIASCSLNTLAILTMNLVTMSTDEDWHAIPFSALFAAFGGVSLSALALLLGMAFRWQTFPRRILLPACMLLGLVGLIGIGVSITETLKVERSALGIADEQYPIAYLAGLTCMAFATVNWPTRPKLSRRT